MLRRVGIEVFYGIGVAAYWLGDVTRLSCISGIPYAVYNWAMLWSVSIQGESEDGPWRKPDDSN